MHSHGALWIWYLIGAFSTLAWKWVRWCVTGAKPPLSKPWWASTKEWFSISLLEDRVSWGTTVGVVWVVGAVFINKIPFMWEWLGSVPQDDSIAFLMGSVMEFIAPAGARWLIGKVPGAGGEP